MSVESLTTLPKPTDANALRAFLEATMADVQGSIRADVRKMMNNALLSHGQIREGAMRVVWRTSEGFSSVADRIVYIGWLAGKIEAMMAESSALEN